MADSTVMSRARWERIQELFNGASSVDAAERPSWLAERCGDDAGLHAQVAALLAASTDASTDIERAFAGALGEIDAVKPGQRIGRYRVLNLLGRGGMGAVYLAERADEQFHQQVALKLIGRTLPTGTLARRFRAERQILANLNHPNIARLLDGGATDDGVPYLAMEYIQGARIDRYCSERQLGIPQRLRLFQRVCAAVQYAHQNLVVHRDIKPSNILVDDAGTPKLLDFGIAKLLDAQQTSDVEGLTRLHERVLTPEHASPEQVRGDPIGTVSDVYSLGVLLYELLTGARPYALGGRSFEEMQHVICNLEPPKPSAVVRALAGDLDNIVLRAMHKEPQRRYSSAAALAEDIDRYLENRPVRARPDAWTYRTGKFIRRNATALATTAAVTLAIAGLVVFYTMRLTEERDAAEHERLTASAVSQFMEEVFRVANPSESRGNSVTVREVLDTAVKRIDTDLQTQPRVRVTLLRTIGEVYNGLGLWKQAQALFERAVAQERESFGNHHVELSLALSSLASTHHNLNRFDTELQLYQEAWQIRRTLGLDHDAEAAGLLSAMASSLRAQQRYPEALEYHRQAEAVARSLNPQQPQVLGQALQGYAMTYLLMGEHAQAERFARDSLELVRGAIYEGTDLYPNSVYALAESLRRQYKLEESGKLQRELLDLQIQRLGPDAQLVARTWNNLSHVMRASGKYAEAQDALTHAISIYEKQPDVSGFDLAVSYHNLGGLQNEAGEHAQALQSLQRSLELKQRLTGPRSPQLISTMLEIAAARREMNELAAAEESLAGAEALARASMPANDKRYAQISLERARLALARGDSAAAEAAARAALERIDEQDPGRLATIQCVLAEALVARGETSEAHALLDRALATRRHIMPAGHWMIADAERRLGEVLAAERRLHANRGRATR